MIQVRAGEAAKWGSRIRTLDQPAYSPDFNPLDYSLWAAIQKKALAGSESGETIDQYKKKLRRTALRMSCRHVRTAVEQIKKRAQAIFEADGNDIALD